jgi:hypothetical protein
VEWLLTAVTFLTIFDVWHEYLMMVLLYVWLPSLLDSLIPFAFLVAELFLAHLVYRAIQGWLLAYAACYLVGAAAWLLKTRQVRALDAENRRVRTVVGRYDRFRGLLACTLGGASLAAGALYGVLGLGHADLLLAGAAAVGGVLFILSSAPMWNRVLELGYAERRA